MSNSPRRSPRQKNETKSEPESPPAVREPIKWRGQRAVSKPIAQQSDAEVWNLDDKDIIEAALNSWRSESYKHFDVTLERNQKTKEILFFFTCKVDFARHKVQTRPRMKTGDGTKNLIKAINACDTRNKQVTSKQQTITHALDVYDPYRHRALVALRAAHSHRPFDAVEDELYMLEVEILRPGTNIHSRSTVSNDMKKLHDFTARELKKYLEDQSCVHVVMDGWTNPQFLSFISVVFVWYANGQIHRSVIEFIKLTSRHTSDYLAQKLFECFENFGVTEKLYTICMDNTSNNDTMVKSLEQLIKCKYPLAHWKGTDYRLRCMPHCLNIMAKVFISYFFQKIPCRLEPDIVGADQDPDDAEVDSVDAGFEMATEKIVQQVATQAERECIEMFGITAHKSNKEVALRLFPRVVGLAKMVHESPPIKKKWEGIINDAKATKRLKGDKEHLDRRVPTRWNSDYECLRAHIHFKEQIRALLTDLDIPDDLSIFDIEEEGFTLANYVVQALAIFEHPTKAFSTASQPLVSDVIAYIGDIEYALERYRDNKEVPSVCRVAAHASLQAVGNYYLLTDQCPILQIAVLVHPSKKLQWFKRQSWPENNIEQAKLIALDEFNRRYPPGQVQRPQSSKDTSELDPSHPSYYASLRRPRTDPDLSNNYNIDSLETFWASPTVQLGNDDLFSYLEAQRKIQPRLVQFQLDILSAPCSSVDAERAFSVGRQTMSHLQYPMSSNTFQASIAVGHWFGQPFMPGIDLLGKALEPKRRTKSTQADITTSSEIEDTEPPRKRQRND